MLRQLLSILVIVFLFVIAAADAAQSTLMSDALTVSQIASGISWAENIAFDNRGSLFATDRLHGSVIRIDYEASNRTYVQSVHLSGMKMLLGLALDPRSNGEYMYAVGRNASDASVVIRFDTKVPQQFKEIAVIPDNKIGNGLGVNFKTGLVYTSTEGNWLPKGGEVYEIDPDSGTVRIISSDRLWAADGLWIDQDNQILYVGQLVEHNVWAYNLALHQEIGIFPGLNNGLLDDFCLSPDGASIIGANWWASTVDIFPIAFNATQSHARVLVPSKPASILMDQGYRREKSLSDSTWFSHPTSARWGSGHPGFPSTSLFVSQGDDIVVSQANNGIFRVDFN